MAEEGEEGGKSLGQGSPHPHPRPSGSMDKDWRLGSRISQGFFRKEMTL